MSALSESNSKSACAFPVISNAKPGALQFGLELRVFLADPVKFDLLGASSLTAQPGRLAHLAPLIAPLRDVRGVQTFTAQKRTAFLAISRVVLIDDPVLELGGEPPTG
jgi:hypothetical protein